MASDVRSLAARGFSLRLDALSFELKRALAEEGVELGVLTEIAGSDRVLSGEAELSRIAREIGSTKPRALAALVAAERRELPTPIGSLPDDDAALKQQVWRRVRGAGVEAVGRELERMEAALEDHAALGAHRAQHVRLKRMFGAMRAEVDRLRDARDAFLEKFRPKAIETAERFLAASRKTVLQAMAAYGVEMDLDEGRAVFHVAHPENVSALVEAAAEI